MIPVFEAQKTISGWKIGLTLDAWQLVDLVWFSYSVDQYACCQSISMGRARSGPLAPLDLLGMLARFLREATDYTRQQIVLPYRPARFAPGKRIMCETIAQIANERLAGTGPFSAGVDTHGLHEVFAPLLVAEAER